VADPSTEFVPVVVNIPSLHFVGGAGIACALASASISKNADVPTNIVRDSLPESVPLLLKSI
jgi:hypothetical protein